MADREAKADRKTEPEPEEIDRRRIQEPAVEEIETVVACPARIAVSPFITERCRYADGHSGPHEDRMGLRWAQADWEVEG